MTHLNDGFAGIACRTDLCGHGWDSVGQSYAILQTRGEAVRRRSDGVLGEQNRGLRGQRRCHGFQMALIEPRVEVQVLIHILHNLDVVSRDPRLEVITRE